MDAAERRQVMIDRHLRDRGIEDPRVLAAMAAVPREAFVAPELAAFAYDDRPLPIAAGQTISQPYIVALMAEALQLRPGDRVLEIGTGSGYGAAVLAHLASHVDTIERLPSLADTARARLAALGHANVFVRCGDGTLGWIEHAPYDGIVVTAAGPGLPPTLCDQLAVGGRLVMPVGSRDDQELVRLTRVAAHDYRREELGGVIFVPLVGAQGWADPDATRGDRL